MFKFDGRVVDTYVSYKKRKNTAKLVKGWGPYLFLGVRLDIGLFCTKRSRWIMVMKRNYGFPSLLLSYGIYIYRIRNRMLFEGFILDWQFEINYIKLNVGF